MLATSQGMVSATTLVGLVKRAVNGKWWDPVVTTPPSGGGSRKKKGPVVVAAQGGVTQ